MRNTLDNEYYACGVFIGLEKTMDTYNSARQIKILWCERNNWSVLNNLYWIDLYWIIDLYIGISKVDTNIKILKNVALKKS